MIVYLLVTRHTDLGGDFEHKSKVFGVIKIVVECFLVRKLGSGRFQKNKYCDSPIKYD